MFAFSLVSVDSFEEVKEMVSQVRETRPNVPAVLAGTKADLNIDLDLSDRVSNWAHQRNVHYIETSARSQVNINELLFMCVSAVRNYRSGINTPPSCTHLHRRACNGCLARSNDVDYYALLRHRRHSQVARAAEAHVRRVAGGNARDARPIGAVPHDAQS